MDPATDKSARRCRHDRAHHRTAVEEIDAQLISGEEDVDIAQTGVQQGSQAKILLDPEKKSTRRAETPASSGTSRSAPRSRRSTTSMPQAVEYATDKIAMQTRAVELTPVATSPSTCCRDHRRHDPNLDPYNTKSGKRRSTRPRKSSPSAQAERLQHRARHPELRQGAQDGGCAAGRRWPSRIVARQDPTDASLYFVRRSARRPTSMPRATA